MTFLNLSSSELLPLCLHTIGTTYWWHTDPPLYQFGYGLSYSSFKFKWSDASLSRPRYHPHNSREQLLSLPAGSRKGGPKSSIGSFAINHSVTVTNSGPTTSDVVVLAFVVATAGSPAEMPLRKLFGFERLVAMAPGKSGMERDDELSHVASLDYQP